MQPLPGCFPPLDVGGEHNLGVGLRVKAMAEDAQLLAKLAEIVDFAVKDERNPSILGDERLVSRDEIDDGEPPHADRHAFGCKLGLAFAIRAAVSNGIAHTCQ